MDKEWWQSNTKRGAVIAGVGTIVLTIGLVDQGKLGLVEGISAIIAAAGAILAVFGLRNALSQ